MTRRGAIPWLGNINLTGDLSCSGLVRPPRTALRLSAVASFQLGMIPIVVLPRSSGRFPTLAISGDNGRPGTSLDEHPQAHLASLAWRIINTSPLSSNDTSACVTLSCTQYYGMGETT